MQAMMKTCVLVNFVQSFIAEFQVEFEGEGVVVVHVVVFL